MITKKIKGETESYYQAAFESYKKNHPQFKTVKSTLSFSKNKSLYKWDETNESTIPEEQIKEWVHLPMLCPTGPNYEYQGIRFIATGETERYRCDYFDQGSEQWFLRERQAKQMHKTSRLPWKDKNIEPKNGSFLQEKYRRISSWLKLFPFFCGENLSMGEFFERYNVHYHAQLTYEIENDLIHWGDILGLVKSELDTLLLQHSISDQQSPTTKKSGTKKPLSPAIPQHPAFIGTITFFA